ncbi:MAG: hypothetical protein H6Q10_2820 [Acidobacteria bacterium]|nr:hypothetical protein [Acidobacteriota bacterium]
MGCRARSSHLAARVPGGRADVEVEAQPVERPPCGDAERRLEVDPGDGRQHAPDLGERQLVRGSGQLHHRPVEVVDDPAVHPHRALGRADRDVVQVQVAVALGHGARQLVQRDVRVAGAERKVADARGVVHRLVLEADAGVQAIDHPRRGIPGGPRGPGGALLPHLQPAVADADLADGHGPPRPGTLLLARLALDEPGQVPSLRRPLEDDLRRIQADVIDDEVARDQLDRAVVDPGVAHRHDPLAVHHQSDVLQLEAEEEVPPEAADRQRPVQVLLRLLHDEPAQPVPEPRGLRHDDRGRRGADEERRDEEEHLEGAPEDDHGASLRRPGRC